MKCIKIILVVALFYHGQLFLVNPLWAQNAKPNVILVITDDQGYGDIAAHGNKQIKTPHLDAFYKESFHLTDFHVSPTCAPTRAALMTGRDANSTGVWHTVGGWSLLREEEKTMADMFSEAGYITGAFGKWHLGDNYPYRPEDRGFDEVVRHGGGGVQQTPDYWGNTYFNDTYFHNGKPEKYEGYCTDVFFNEAIGFIEKNHNKPFFCYIAPNAPHGPYNVPTEYYDLYKNLDESVLKDTQKRFYGMITNIDDNFGKLREALERLKVADNTILIFMTDNGTAAGYYNKANSITGFNAGMRGTKGSEYEGGHRVPFFIYWKDGKIDVAKDIDALTAHVDVLPTLASLCGISLPRGAKKLRGQSLVPILKNPEQELDRMLISDSQRLQKPKKWKNSSIMDDKWRLINGKELYNLDRDPGQQKDVSGQHSQRVSSMRSFYESWWEEVSVEFDEEIYFKLGLENENPLTLTAHDTHTLEGGQPWNQIQIRNGADGSGYWSVDIMEAGEYEISLRRYPIESGLRINEQIDGISTKELPGLEFNIPAGKSLKYIKATMRIGKDIQKEVNVSDKDVQAIFKLPLKAGKTKLYASFIDKDGKENTAYYVYVEKIRP